MHIVSLYRYPVKGLSPERLQSVCVATGEGFPLDRRYALLRTDAVFDPEAPVWLAKANFVMLMLHEQIAGLRIRYFDQDNTLSLRTPEGRDLVFKLDEAEGRAALEKFFHDFMPNRLSTPPRLVEAQGHQFTDKAEKYLSLINLASVRELEKRWEQHLDPLRFRANVYIDTAEAFSELDWVGQSIRLGPVAVDVVRPNGRCAATNVNPDTGVRDRDVPGKLRADFGHKDLGVYLRVTQGGQVSEGDRVTLDPIAIAAERRRPVNSVDTAAGQLICTACYYRFDPRKQHAAWISPHDLPDNWRCPDCGATRESVVLAVAHTPGAGG